MSEEVKVDNRTFRISREGETVVFAVSVLDQPSTSTVLTNAQAYEIAAALFRVSGIDVRSLQRRDAFAAAALQGLMANVEYKGVRQSPVPEKTAEDAAKFADALVAKLDKAPAEPLSKRPDSSVRWLRAEHMLRQLGLDMFIPNSSLSWMPPSDAKVERIRQAVAEALGRKSVSDAESAAEFEKKRALVQSIGAHNADLEAATKKALAWEMEAEKSEVEIARLKKELEQERGFGTNIAMQKLQADLEAANKKAAHWERVAEIGRQNRLRDFGDGRAEGAKLQLEECSRLHAELAQEVEKRHQLLRQDDAKRTRIVSLTMALAVACTTVENEIPMMSGTAAEDARNSIRVWRKLLDE